MARTVSQRCSPLCHRIKAIVKESVRNNHTQHMEQEKVNNNHNNEINKLNQEFKRKEKKKKSRHRQRMCALMAKLWTYLYINKKT